MAKKYATVDPNIWNQGEFRRLLEDARWLLLYLSTCAHSEANCYVLTMPTLCDDIQWDVGRVNRALQSLAKKPFALYDAISRVVYLPGYWDNDRNKIPNSNTATYIARHLYNLPNSELKAKAIADLRATKYFSEAVERILARWSYAAMDDEHAIDPRQGNLLGDDQPAKPPKADKPKREATRISADWQPTDEMRDYARNKGMMDPTIDGEVVKFVRYFTSADAKEPAKKDWYRAWCNWIDRALERKPSNGNGAHAPADMGGGIIKSDLDWEWKMKLYYGPKRIWQGAWGPKPGEPHCEVPAKFIRPPE